MSSTNKTSYYELSQYIGTDIPNPLTDYNNDMSKIDTALHNVAETVASDSATVTALGNRVGVVEGNVETLATQAGSDALATTAQTLSGAVNELKAGVDDNTSDIVALNSAVASKADSSQLTALTTRVTNAETKIGTASLNTTAQNLSDAVNELKNAVDAIPSATPYTAGSGIDITNHVVSIKEPLTTTLSAGSTTATISDNSITANSFVLPVASVWGVLPTNVTVSNGSVTMTFDAQASTMTVGVMVLS